MIRKWFNGSPDSSGFDHDPEYDQFSVNRRLMVYIGDEVVYDEEQDTEGFENKVDFLYRIILSDLMLDEKHAIKLEPKKSLLYE